MFLVNRQLLLVGPKYCGICVGTVHTAFVLAEFNMKFEKLNSQVLFLEFYINLVFFIYYLFKNFFL